MKFGSSFWNSEGKPVWSDTWWVLQGKQDFPVVVSAAEIKMNEIESACSSNFKTPWNVTDTGLGSNASPRAMKWLLQSTSDFNCLYYRLRCLSMNNYIAMCQGHQDSRSSQDKPSCSVLTWGYSVVLLRWFKGIDAKPNRVFFKSGIFPFFHSSWSPCWVAL